MCTASEKRSSRLHRVIRDAFNEKEGEGKSANVIWEWGEYEKEKRKKGNCEKTMRKRKDVGKISVKIVKINIKAKIKMSEEQLLAYYSLGGETSIPPVGKGRKIWFSD